jgi:hypothetical protein
LSRQGQNVGRKPYQNVMDKSKIDEIAINKMRNFDKNNSNLKKNLRVLNYLLSLRLKF